MSDFLGFSEPESNYSKLPHDFISLLPVFSSEAEIKVVLYILRHTWGYHQSERLITLDEFQNGRWGKNGERLDNGTGMSKPAILRGLAAAEEHSFILIVKDETDLGRKKHTYCLRYRNVTSNDVTIRYPSGDETLPRTEKDSLETNSNNADSEKPKRPRNGRGIRGSLSAASIRLDPPDPPKPKKKAEPVLFLALYRDAELVDQVARLWGTYAGEIKASMSDKKLATFFHEWQRRADDLLLELDKIEVACKLDDMTKFFTTWLPTKDGDYKVRRVETAVSKYVKFESDTDTEEHYRGRYTASRME